MERVRKSNDVTYCLYGGYESAHNGAGGNMLNLHHKKKPHLREQQQIGKP